MMYNLFDLFSGIGGFSLAARWTGKIRTVAFCEIDDFCRQVLKLRFPNIPIFRDIRSITSEEIKKTIKEDEIHIITGGFPCQPFSVSGKRTGKSDNHYLWPEMFRVIQLCKPTWVVTENVYGLLTIEQGMVFKQICDDLESEDYEVQPFVIPACAINAPHRRDRVWIIAHSKKAKNYTNGVSTYTNNERYIRWWQSRNTIQSSKIWIENWTQIATKLCRMDDGFSVRMDEFELSEAGHRRRRIKALGNAIVPQIAFILLSIILYVEEVMNKNVNKNFKRSWL